MEHTKWLEAHNEIRKLLRKQSIGHNMIVEGFTEARYILDTDSVLKMKLLQTILELCFRYGVYLNITHYGIIITMDE